MIEPAECFEVMRRIDHAHPKNTNYPLLHEDILVRQEDGTFYKIGPGLGMTGFVLTPEQVAELRPTRFVMFGLEMAVRPPVSLAANGAWRVDIPGVGSYEERVEIVGHLPLGENQPHWEQFVWPDEASAVLNAHLAQCEIN